MVGRQAGHKAVGEQRRDRLDRRVVVRRAVGRHDHRSIADVEVHVTCSDNPVIALDQAGRGQWHDVHAERFRPRPRIGIASSTDEPEWARELLNRVVVRGVALDKNQAKVTLVGVPDKPGAVGAIFTPLALYTLGAQIAAARSMRLELVPQALILLLKLLVAPVITLYLCRLLGVPSDVTAVMVVASATPVGVLITIFAAELKAEPEFISTATVITTALSPLTVTAWIIAMRMM